MLRWRLIAAACIIFPLLFIIWLDDQHNFGRPGIYLIPVAVVVSQMACAELCELFKAKSIPLRCRTFHLATLMPPLFAAVPCIWNGQFASTPARNLGWLAAGVTVGFGLIAVVEIIRYHEPGENLVRLASGTFVVCYAGLLMGFFVELRLLIPGRKGLAAVIGTILIVKLSDAGAYFVGRAFGRNKLFPVLSPGKTWEGVLGGLGVAIAGSACFFFLLLPMLGVERNTTYQSWVWIIYALSLTVVGIFGDLFESLLKRDAKIKDSSHWMPGLGGVLDVIDSMVAVAPLSFAWWASGLI